MSDEINKPHVQHSGRPRTLIPLNRGLNKSSISVLRFEDMVISDGKDRKFNFNRFRFLGVPTQRSIAKGKVVNAGRDNLVKELYALAIQEKQGYSILSHFKGGLVSYLRYIDSIAYTDDPFSLEIMCKCLKHYNARRKRGKEISKAYVIQVILAWLLSKWGRYSDIRKLPIVPQKERSCALTAYKVETELKSISSLLVNSLHKLMSHVEQSQTPSIHPMFSEELLTEQARLNSWSAIELSNKRKAFRLCMMVPPVNKRNSNLSEEELKFNLLANHASRNALYVFFMLTGMNNAVLSSIRRMDVKFKDINGGRYVFEGEKFRAGYKKIDSSLGFSKYTKELIEKWMRMTKFLYEKLGHKEIDTLPLFPYLELKNGRVLDFTYNKSNTEYINKLVEKLLGVRVNAARFRKTKSDVLMRVTEDVVLVSLGLNNTVRTVSSAYCNGIKDDHDNNLNAAFSAQMSIAKGKDISESVAEVKALQSDILSDYDYKQRLVKGKLCTTITPSGVHCSGPTSKKLSLESQRKKHQGVNLDNDEHKCTDFLGCFDCESHLLVASEFDIWLMLSFLEQLTDLKEYISINSTPKTKLFETEAIISKTLERMKVKSPSNYDKALRRIHEGELHPLYQNRASLQPYFGD
ncbi:hypothetical protein [Vibrio campbellii]|uniref:hypothetical protein n=1 Tax=Vibrio campbellii TaxID=680 RepID=UPI0005EEE1D3|nr:hypothetical protein [Vibrio campbellii]